MSILTLHPDDESEGAPEKEFVTGPVYLVLEDVPLYPIGLPFCFFPFSSTYSSGIIMPTFGDESTRGFFLRDGGYYFALSDYMDLALLGEIYTKGSWDCRPSRLTANVINSRAVLMLLIW